MSLSLRTRRKRNEIKELRRQILQMFADGLGCREMMDLLHTSEANIRYHLQRIYRELNIHSIGKATSLFERKKYAALISALKKLSRKDPPLAKLLKQFQVM